MNIWSDIRFLDRMEIVRDLLRKSGKRLSFDCLKLMTKGDRVRCSEGKHLGQAKDGTIHLKTVLRGITSGVCIDCELFSTEDDG